MKKLILIMCVALLATISCFAKSASRQEVDYENFILASYLDASSPDPTAMQVTNLLDDGKNDLSHLDIVIVGFSDLDSEGDLDWPVNCRRPNIDGQKGDLTNIKEFKDKTEAKILLSIGGGSTHMTWPTIDAVELGGKVADFYLKYDDILDGFDFDIEGATVPFNNSISEFVKFLIAIREKVNSKGKEIILGFAPQPYHNPDTGKNSLVMAGNLPFIVSDEKMVEQLDYLFIQAYNIHDKDTVFRPISDSAGELAKLKDFFPNIPQEKFILGKPVETGANSGYNPAKELVENKDAIKAASGGMMVWDIVHDLKGYPSEFPFIAELAKMK